MTPTPIPTLPISIYPETWENASRTLQQAFGIGFDDIAIAFTILVVAAIAITILIKRMSLA